MTKTAKILLLAFAAFFFFIGVKSSMHATAYKDLDNVQTSRGKIIKLHCPRKGAAALSLSDSDTTYNLTTKFKAQYCDDKKSQPLLGKEVTMQSVQVSEGYHQVYQLKDKNQDIVTPQNVESDQANITLGLFLIAFLLTALVAYKSRKKVTRQDN